MSTWGLRPSVRFQGMAELGSVAWPPAPIRAERLVLRPSEPRVRMTVVELHATPDVYAYLGGPQPRDQLEEVVPEMPGRRPGFFVTERAGSMIGMVSLSRRDADRRGHLGPEAGEVELSYLFLPEAWGHGYAAEACGAALPRGSLEGSCEEHDALRGGPAIRRPNDSWRGR